MIAIAGMIGGIANTLIDLKLWKEVWLPNLGLGAIAALLVYFLGANELDAPKQMGAALLAGLGGGSLITTFKQRALQSQTINELSEALQQFNQNFKKLIEEKPEERKEEDTNG